MEITSIQGPVERENDQLILLIPLSEGGENLKDASKGIGTVEGENLKVVIPDFISKHLSITEGDEVLVDNQNGKFNIHKAQKS